MSKPQRLFAGRVLFSEVLYVDVSFSDGGLFSSVCRDRRPSFDKVVCSGSLPHRAFSLFRGFLTHLAALLRDFPF